MSSAEVDWRSASKGLMFAGLGMSTQGLGGRAAHERIAGRSVPRAPAHAARPGAARAARRAPSARGRAARDRSRSWRQASSVRSSSTPLRCRTQRAWTRCGWRSRREMPPRAQRDRRVVAAALDELVGRRDPHRQVGVAEVRDQLLDRALRAIDRSRAAAASLPSVPR